MKRRGFLKVILGALGTACVPSSTMLKSKSYLVPNKTIRILPPDEPKKLKLGWTIREEIGIGIMNSRAFAIASNRS